MYICLCGSVLWCMLCRPPGKQPLAEGGYAVEIKVNNNNNIYPNHFKNLVTPRMLAVDIPGKEDEGGQTVET